MTGSTTPESLDAMSNHELFIDINGISKNLITDLLTRMIASASGYHGWSLSDQDGARVVKLIQHKQRIICSSFSFQMSKHFAEFEAGDSKHSAAGGWQRLGLSSVFDSLETDELQDITARYGKAFHEFDVKITRRLGVCVGRGDADIFENPLHVKRLCESFRYSIDSLNLEISCKIALYRLFADRFIEALGPVYRQIDAAMRDQGILPGLEPARMALRSMEGLSESRAPEGLHPDQTLCMLALVQRFRDRSRDVARSGEILFPELKRRLLRCGINRYHDQLDLLHGMFKLIFEDEDLPEAVKLQLGRLQIHLFMNAIHDDGFLRRSTNPARRLLDGVIASEVEIARSGRPDLSGVDYLREQIDALNAANRIEADAYARLLEGYREHLKTVETSANKARRTEAVRKMLPRVKGKLSEITQPLKIQGTSLILFDKVWLPLLLQIALRQGIDSEAWHNTMAIVRRQVWSLIPKSTPGEKQELLAALPEIAHSLHRAMRSMRLADGLQQSLREYLKLEQQNVIQKTDRCIAEAERRKLPLSVQTANRLEDSQEFDSMMQTGVFQVPTDMMETLKSAQQTRQPEKPSEVESLATGEWVSMLRGGEKVLAKLAWKAADLSLFIFVDRDGARVCEIDGEQLARRFASGDVSLLKSGTTDSEKSRFSVLKTLR